MSENRYRRKHPEDELTPEEEAFLRGEELKPEEEEVEEATPSDGLLSPEEATYKKRYSDLRRHLQQKEDEYKRKIEELKKQAPQQMPKTKEEVQEWVEKYPDLAAILKTLMREEIGTAVPKDDSALQKLKELETKLEMAEARKILMKLHPDFDEIRNDDKFHQWAKDQPQMIQDALYKSLDPYACARAVDLYKVDAGITKKAPKSQDNRSAASSVSQGRPAQVSGENIVWSESRVAKLSSREFEKYEEEIDEAIRKGKFEYDLSGGAR